MIKTALYACRKDDIFNNMKFQYIPYTFNSIWEEILSDRDAGIEIQSFSSRS